MPNYNYANYLYSSLIALSFMYIGDYDTAIKICEDNLAKGDMVYHSMAALYSIFGHCYYFNGV